MYAHSCRWWLLHTAHTCINSRTSTRLRHRRTSLHDACSIVQPCSGTCCTTITTLQALTLGGILVGSELSTRVSWPWTWMKPVATSTQMSTSLVRTSKPSWNGRYWDTLASQTPGPVNIVMKCIKAME